MRNDSITWDQTNKFQALNNKIRIEIHTDEEQIETWFDIEFKQLWAWTEAE